MVNIILAGGQVLTEDGVVTDSALVIQDQQIIDIIPKAKAHAFKDHQVCDFSNDYVIMPGFIDMHIHGSNGKDVMDASFAALKTISESLAKQGTTAFLATTMTAAKNQIENVLSHVRDYHKRQAGIVGAEILGVHLEGPFISRNKMGAQQEDFLLVPDIQLFEQWQKVSGGLIKLVTLAPELPKSAEFIRYLKENNIIASIGHTDATFDETILGIKAGCTHATHLFNAMRGVTQREPGTVTAILLSKQVMAELIVDGVHLHPAMVDLAYKLKQKDQLVLVSDAMRAQCLPDGEYDLGGQNAVVKNNEARLPNGKLAGSTVKLVDAMKLFMQYTGCDLFEAMQLTSINPAKALGVFERKGSIALGKDADLVVLDKHNQLVMTICDGRIVKPNLNIG